MDEVEVVVAHSQRATLRVGDVFLKVDGDPAHADVEVRAMAMAPVPTPAILWREPHIRRWRELATFLRDRPIPFRFGQ